MSIEIKIILILTAVILILAWLYRRKIGQCIVLEESHADIKFRKQSQSSRYGKMTEQFLPFLKNYPYDSQKFRFLGTPIDGIQFNEDGIILIEFKTAGSKLSQNQRQIKNLIEQKKVEFQEFRID